MSKRPNEPEIMEETESRLKEALMRLVSIRPRTELEIRTYLRKKLSNHNSGTEIADRLIDNLKSLGFINDRNFAEWFVNARGGRAARGNQIIQAELIAKGVDKELIDEFCKDGLSAESERERAARFIRSCPKKWQHLTGQKQRLKIYRLLVSRGFSYSLVSRFIDEFTAKD